MSLGGGPDRVPTTRSADGRLTDVELAQIAVISNVRLVRRVIGVAAEGVGFSFVSRSSDQPVGIDVDLQAVEEDVAVGAEAQEVVQFVGAVVGSAQASYVRRLAVRALQVAECRAADLAGQTSALSS